MWFCVILLVFITLLVLSKSKTFIGWIGERSVASELNKLNKQEYRVLHNITIPTSSNRTAQIDHLVISRYGIFVIETKNYTGWILGSEMNDTWTQVIFNRKEKFRNPIHQNYGHIKSIEQLIQVEKPLPFVGIVCFSGRSTLKVNAKHSEVIYTGDLVRTINKYRNIQLNQDEVDFVTKRIDESQLKDKNIKKTHIHNIKTNIVDKEIQVANNVCPRCGGNLVIKSGKLGRFKGCTSYPKCRFTYQLK